MPTKPKNSLSWQHVAIITTAVLCGSIIVLAPQFLLANNIDTDEFTKAGAGLGALGAVSAFAAGVWKLIR